MSNARPDGEPYEWASHQIKSRRPAAWTGLCRIPFRGTGVV